MKDGPPATETIPRPRGRGLIEATRTSSEANTSWQFHDRAVVASLKRESRRVSRGTHERIPRPRGRGLIEALKAACEAVADCEFHDRAVVASLKPFPPRADVPVPAQFHDRAVVA